MIIPIGYDLKKIITSHQKRERIMILYNKVVILDFDFYVGDISSGVTQSTFSM